MKLDSKMVITMLALLFNDQEGDNFSTVQRIEAKENENGFLELSFDELSNEYAHSPRDTIIHCLPIIVKKSSIFVLVKQITFFQKHIYTESSNLSSQQDTVK